MATPWHSLRRSGSPAGISHRRRGAAPRSGCRACPSSRSVRLAGQALGALPSTRKTETSVGAPRSAIRASRRRPAVSASLPLVMNDLAAIEHPARRPLRTALACACPARRSPRPARSAPRNRSPRREQSAGQDSAFFCSCVAVARDRTHDRAPRVRQRTGKRSLSARASSSMISVSGQVVAACCLRTPRARARPGRRALAEAFRKKLAREPVVRVDASRRSARARSRAKPSGHRRPGSAAVRRSGSFRSRCRVGFLRTWKIVSSGRRIAVNGATEHGSPYRSRSSMAGSSAPDMSGSGV